jgi:subtilisin family serine protease
MHRACLKTGSVVTLFCFLFLLLAVSSSAPVSANGKASEKGVPIVRDLPKAEFLQNLAAVEKMKTFEMLSWEPISMGYTRLWVQGDVKIACDELMTNPNVEVAEPNYIRYLQVTPNDPLFVNQTNLKMANAETGWNIETGDATVTIAVIDTGCDLNHPDLKANLLEGANFREDGGSAADDSGHGTAVTGVCGAIGNNSTGVTGASWNVKILPLRACGGQGLSCNVVDEVEAINEAVARGADIINLSLGGFGRSSLEEGAVDDAWAAGVILFAAAGNHGLLGKFGDPDTESNINYPAGYDNCVGVSSIDYPANGNLSLVQLSDFSNSGDAVSVTAQGRDIYTTAPSVDVPYLIFSTKADYGVIPGTSFSTPLVSGLAAVILSHFPNLTNQELRAKIQSSATDLGPAGWDDQFGWGLVDFRKALEGSTYGSNSDFNVGITTSPILNDDVIVVCKVKVQINGSPVVSYSYTEGSTLHTGFVTLVPMQGNTTIWTGRISTLFSGNITFKANGVGSGGNLNELVLDYFKGKSN